MNHFASRKESKNTLIQPVNNKPVVTNSLEGKTATSTTSQNFGLPCNMFQQVEEAPAIPITTQTSTNEVPQQKNRNNDTAGTPMSLRNPSM